MSRIVMPATVYTALRRTMDSSAEETAAILWCNAVILDGRLVRIVAHELATIPEEAYELRTRTRIRLRPAFIARLSKEARVRHESIVFVHSHVDASAFFSSTDDAGEPPLAAFLHMRTPGLIHATMVYSPAGCVARVLTHGETLRVFAIGHDLSLLSPEKGALPSHDSYDRQIRAFGEQGQALLRTLRVAIVGNGGTGSVVAQQLAYLGVGSFLLIEPDVVDHTNLNRLVGASPNDVTRSKAEVVREMILRVQPEAAVECAIDSINKRSIVEKLTDCDFVFCCTDSHGSRYVANQMAYQFLLPVIDLGVVINARQTPMQLRLRVQALGPEMPCLTCMNYLDADAVRHDLQTDAERRADPYFTGPGEPAPAVISLNSAACSAAVSMFLSITTGIPGPRAIQGDLATGHVKPFRADSHPKCVTCSQFGVFAQALRCELPGRAQ